MTCGAETDSILIFNEMGITYNELANLIEDQVILGRKPR